MEEHWGCWWKLTDEGGQSALPRSLLTGSEISPSKKDLKVNKGRVICSVSNVVCLLQMDDQILKVSCV